ncbi:sensor histidine kinase [Williamsia sterculiae]|uniref:histidine kinase n=1 Tax=Williamsia sterculiae TaxID=1344003 RepID=A0A1N7DEH2_9NOCA|nr:HAMP domain-containing sensor histidine kinase [Williamsia sterculiae]SIR74243.1 two-component system, OmpR family, sensor histidine kinase PrrB [Williamsia sterculiae]
MTRRRRSPSLRLRVTLAAAAVTTAIVVVIGGALWSQLSSSAYRELDGQVNTVSAAVQPSISASNSQTITQSTSQGVLTTVRLAGVKVLGTTTTIPQQADGVTDLTIDDTRYRVKTSSVLSGQGLSGLATVSVAVPLQPTLDRISGQRRTLLLASGGSVVASAILGWLLAGLAIRPLRRLADRTHALPSDAGAAAPERAALLDVHGAREAEELAAAINELLGRIDTERARTHDALVTARDFASVSAHELRTPLTAMRTDLEVLATMNPGPRDRAEIVADLQRAQLRVGETLAALEALAQGNLGGQPMERVDLVDLCDHAASEAHRRHPEVTIELDGPTAVPASANPAGIRLIVSNAITNAIRHGRATRVMVGVHPTSDGPVWLTVDDNGRGVPQEERSSVFGRFVRGAAPISAGSGLGLSLVAQQAELHGGTAELTDSPLGGARLVVRLG